MCQRFDVTGNLKNFVKFFGNLTGPVDRWPEQTKRIRRILPDRSRELPISLTMTCFGCRVWRATRNGSGFFFWQHGSGFRINWLANVQAAGGGAAAADPVLGLDRGGRAHWVRDAPGRARRRSTCSASLHRPSRRVTGTCSQFLQSTNPNVNVRVVLPHLLHCPLARCTTYYVWTTLMFSVSRVIGSHLKTLHLLLSNV
jgi:hypothetical protein